MRVGLLLLLGLGAFILVSCDEDVGVNPLPDNGSVSFFLRIPKAIVDDGNYRYRVHAYFDLGDSCSFAFSKYVNPIDTSISGPWQISLVGGEMTEYTYSCAAWLKPSSYSLLGTVTASYQGTFPDSLVATFFDYPFEVKAGTNTSLGTLSVSVP